MKPSTNPRIGQLETEIAFLSMLMHLRTSNHSLSISAVNDEHFLERPIFQKLI